jgi:hypothetical protein
MTLKVVAQASEGRLSTSSAAQLDAQKAERGYLKNNFSARWNRENQGAFLPRNPRDVCVVH